MGEKYGHWEVIGKEIKKGKYYFLPCRCICGTERLVEKSSLIKGKSLSCGCIKKPPSNFQDLTGQVFSELTVLGISRKEKGIVFYNCKCTCKNITEVRAGDLRSGHTKSCGCKVHNQAYKDLTGKVFGKLTVVKRVENRLGKVNYLCRCECGKEKEVLQNYLQVGSTYSCGCTDIAHKGSRAENEIYEYIKKLIGE